MYLVETASEGIEAKKTGSKVERAAYTVAEFTEAYRISRRELYRLWTQGQGPTKTKIGSRTLIGVDAARAWFASLNQSEAA